MTDPTDNVAAAVVPVDLTCHYCGGNRMEINTEIVPEIHCEDCRAVWMDGGGALTVPTPWVAEDARNRREADDR